MALVLLRHVVQFAFILALTDAGLPAQTDVQYEHDAEGQLTKATYSDGLTIEYSYDTAGNLKSRQSTRSETKVYFPFYQAGPGTFVGFAFSNYSSQPAKLEFTAFGRNGNLLGTQQNPSTHNLSSGTQKALLGREIFSISSGQEKAGWVELLTDNEKLGTFFLFGDSSLTRLDGAPASLEPSPVIYFSRIYEGPTAYRGQPATTSLSLANPNDLPLQVELSLYAKNGAAPEDYSVSLSAQKTVGLAPKGYLYGSISELFERSSISGGYVKAEVAGVEYYPAASRPLTGIVGFELVQLLNVPTVIGLAATEPKTGGERLWVYSPQLTESSDIFSNLNLINTSSGDQWVSVQFYEGCRSECAYEDQVYLQTIVLKPGEILIGDVREILGLDPTEILSLNGFLEVHASYSAVVDLIFGDPVGHRYAAAFPLQQESYLKAVLNHFADSSSFFTGLAFLNTGSGNSAVVRVRVRGVDGTLIGESSFELEARQRVAKLVPQLIPEAADHIGGFIEIDSNVPIIVQQIFGETSLNMFSTIPPTVVDLSQ